MPASVDQVFAEALEHHHAGRLAEAEKGYRLILEAVPEHADSLHLLGVIGLQTGHLEPALDLVQRAVSLRPDGAVYHSNLGQVLERLGRFDDAERAYRMASEVDPGCAEAFNNLGRLLQGEGQLGEAESHLRKAIEISPDYAEPHANLGNLLKDRGDLDGAIEAFRRAIELRPDLSMLHSNLLLTLHYHADYSPADLAREHRQWAERHVWPLRSERAPHRNHPDPNRRLKVGYVSPDFRAHAVARFMLPLLENHDRQSVEIYAYSDVARPDEMTDRIRAECDHWHDIGTSGDRQLAASVRSDGIDILVDLAAHSGRNRLLTFARKPAPVQITYLAYCSTTGVDAIDYRLTDRFLDPSSDDEANYSERSIHLPHCYWCYAAPSSSAMPRPVDEGRRGPPTFGCLNNFAKITDATLALWTRLMQRVPEARLLVYARAEPHHIRLRQAWQQAGLSESRLEFVGWQPLEPYLETYRRIDVGLDPFPYTGGTTTCDALWMGVPVVTLAGRTAVSRGGATLLSNVGLPELVAHDEAQYVDIAAALLRDEDRLDVMRRKLRSRLESSPVMDAQRFARDIESVFRNAWQTWCAGPASGN
ncbi:MAG TPA: tetratricopeptide repeat protein [Gammaproteobacteria bacterium]|nr:tetratricopeptide repeat protein [Gammaproteobacteria bacterium]